MHKKIFNEFIEHIKNSGNLFLIPQLRGAQPFHVSVNVQKGVLGLLVDKRVMPLDPFFPIEIFEFVLRILQDAPNYTLPRGDAMNYAIGQSGLSLNSIEARVAVKFYGKKKDDFTFRRISVIANVLVRSGVCEHGKGVLRLKTLSSKDNKKRPPENNLSSPIFPITPPKVPANNLFVNYTKNDDQLCPLPNYLIVNAGRITSLGKQKIDLITIKYSDERFMKFPIMNEFHKSFPNLKRDGIQRSDVSELFRKKKYYLAFITTMIWGGINATRPQKKAEFETVNLYKVLNEDKKRIEKIILRVKQLLIKGKIEECFNYLSGDGRVNGVGYAYFTKLMYFIAYSEKRIKIKPLIFDKWTSNAYKALLINSGQITKMRALYTPSINRDNKTVSLRRPISKAYLSFVLDMQCWASQMGVNPSKLEEFVFGISLKKCKAGSNPRRQLWAIILDYHNNF